MQSAADEAGFLFPLVLGIEATLGPGDIVIIDNLGRHKGKGHSRNRREAALPTEILADLNPIEQVFAVLRRKRHKTEKRWLGD